MARGAGATSWLLGAGLLALGVLMVALLVLDEPPGRPASRAVDLRSEDGPDETGRPPPRPLEQGTTAEPLQVVATDGVHAGAPPGPTRTVAGRVLRLADRSPLPACRLAASRAATTTSDEGGFVLAGVGAAEGSLVLELHGRRLVLELPPRAGDLADLVLTADTGWNVPVLVLSDDGSPLAGAALFADGRPRGEADGSGRLLLQDVAPGRSSASPARIAASAPWHERREVFVRLPEDARVAPLLEVRLAAAGALAGVVTAPDGMALGGRTVAVRFGFVGGQLDRRPEHLAATSGEDGAYRIEGIAPGAYVVSAGRESSQEEASRRLRALGYLADEAERIDRWGGEDHGLSEAWIPSVLVAARQETRLDVRLVPGGVVEGRVTDASGNPLLGARVEVLRSLRWSLPGDAGSHAGLFDAARFRAEDGEAHLTVDQGSTGSDEQGRFRLVRLPAGEVILRAGHPGQPGWQPVEVVLELAAGGRVGAVELVLGRGRLVRGRVFDERGAPVAGAQVALLPADGAAVVTAGEGLLTDETGRFEFAGLGAGELALHVSHPGHRTQLLAVSAGGGELRIDLAPAPVVEGEVLDAATLAPVTGFRLLAENQSGSLWRDGIDDPQGRFVLGELTDEPWTITIEAPGYQSLVIPNVVPRFGAAPLRVLLHSAR